MKCIVNELNHNIDMSILKVAEDTFKVFIREDIKDFYTKNAGGYPLKNVVNFNGEDYEIRVFLSLDKSDEYYCAEKPIIDFLSRTNGKIIPFGIDSEDNYYCINNETGKIYYWSSEVDEYYFIASDLESFVNRFC